MHITAIVLAAGQSRRMGAIKQVLPFAGTTVLQSVIDTLARCRLAETVVVLGCHRNAIEPKLQAGTARIVVNPRPRDGMLSSIQCAIAGTSEETDAWLVALGDQPQITSGVVDALVAAAEAHPGGLLVPTYHGKWGHPVLVSAAYGAEILGMQRTIGLNTLFASHPQDVTEIEVDTDSVLRDIDTPEDYQRALAEASAAPTPVVPH